MPPLTEMLDAVLALFNELNLLPLVAAGGVVSLAGGLAFRIIRAVREPVSLYGPDGYHYHPASNYLDDPDYDRDRDPHFDPYDDPGYQHYLQYATLHDIPDEHILGFEQWEASVSAGDIREDADPFADAVPPDWYDEASGIEYDEQLLNELFGGTESGD